MPEGEVNIELPPSLALARGSGHVHLEFVPTCLFSDAVRSPQEILQAAQRRMIANEDEQAASALRLLPQTEALPLSVVTKPAASSVQGETT